MTVTSTGDPVPVAETPEAVPDTDPCVMLELGGDPTEFAYASFDGWGEAGHPARSARTRVTVEPATRAQADDFPLMDELKRYMVVPDPPPAGSEFVKVSIVHTLRLKEGDPLLADARSPDAVEFSTAFIQSGLGSIDTDATTKYLQTFFYPPQVTPDTGGGAVVTVRGLGYSSFPEKEPLLGLELAAWSGSDSYTEAVVGSHIVQIRFEGWDVIGVVGQVPARLSTGALDLVGGVATSIALAQPGADIPDFTAYLTQGGTLTDRAAEPPEAAAPDLSIVREGLPMAATVLALLVLVVQWLGRAWWRRRLNRFLVAGTVTLYFASAFLLNSDWAGYAGALIWVALVCALAVNHAVRRVGPPRWARRDVLIGSAVLLAAGVALMVTALSWSLESVEWIAVLPVVALPVLFTVIRSWRRMALPVAGVTFATLGLILSAGGRAPSLPLELAAIAGTLIWLVVLAAAIAVSAGGWTGTHALALVMGAAAVHVAQWSVQGSLDWLRLATFTAPLLLVILLMLRLRRLGRLPAAVALGETRASVAFLAMVFYLYPAGIGSIGLASLVALAAVWWLLSGAAAKRPPEFAAITTEAHAAVVAAAIHRRFMRLALRHLYRTGRTRLGTGEMTAASFEEQRTALEGAIASDHPGAVDPDLAFATSGGRTPWQNGVAGLLVALAVTVPFTLVYKRPFAEPTDAVTHLLGTRMFLGLPLFGLIYGYFYPRIRGDHPLSKAANLLVAVLLVEVAAILPELFGAEPPGDRLRLLAIVMGEVTLLAVVLGLFWEGRLMRLAREPWHRIRGLLSVRGLAAPLSALTIAVVTTVGAPFANRLVSSPAEVPAGDLGRRIEAESATGTGVRREPTGDVTGGFSAVTGISRGDRLSYDIDLGPKTASSIRIRLASGLTESAGGQIEVLLDGVTPIGTLGIPLTGDWQNWKTEVEAINRFTGKHTVVLRCKAARPGDIVSINWIEFT
ncbi:carbohydrate-binding protein [Herbidospora mongoliensis]|uniref:carbohydrate-binding protein n=1 Tax=Herbidospora mongoliensis TaxID=688067 RepID=UPI00082CC0B7|nr:carbohydrate-binding protein [Herbidospora mongoliensis]